MAKAKRKKKKNKGWETRRKNAAKTARAVAKAHSKPMRPGRSKGKSSQRTQTGGGTSIRSHGNSRSGAKKSMFRPSTRKAASKSNAADGSSASH